MPESTRAASEVLGFALIFAVIVLSVALVTVAGYQGLDASRDAERVNNAERGVDILADNIDDVVRAGAPSRTTELRVSDADISVGEPVSIRVSGRPVGSATDTFDHQFDVRPLVYEADTDASVVYVTGAVLRTDRSGAILLRDPGFVVAANETVLTVVEPRSVDTSGVGGSGPVHVRVTGDDPVVLVAESTPHEVTVEITSPDAYVWKRYFEAQASETPSMTCSRPASDTVTCHWVTDRVAVTSAGVEVRFD
ncbi:DUF7289 family protein [Halorarius litoreus]|uniref:DUF7289 family protein n=1 Tax=Halorarius litoreus TaxID=2962676 RepID=UPI0020CEBB9A|nr:hypothetical protein [Halorarius litoreus]